MRRLAALTAAIVAFAAMVVLETADRGLVERSIDIGGTPATLLHPAGAGPFPLVIIAHGFAGSRQMMRPAALTLSHAGMATLAFDFAGHGRNPARLSTDVTEIEGTTADLVDETLRVTRAGLALPVTTGPAAFLGHSMATDVIVRAAQAVGATDVVAISTYSEAITPDAPARLLLVSGQWEGHLRAAALDAVRMVDPDAREGEIAQAGGVDRRAMAAPLVGHVGVLWSPATLAAARDWLSPGATGPLGVVGAALALSLGGLLALAHLLVPEGGSPQPPRSVPRGRYWAAVTVPIAPAVAVAFAVDMPIRGMAGFSSLAAFLAVWGGLQLAILRPAIGHIGWATAGLLLWALTFALALDRYGAAFLPTASRTAILAALLPGALAAMLADGWIARHGAHWQRLLARVVLIAALAAPMLFAPVRLGLLFTAIPVAVLFFLVFGTVAGRIARRAGPTGPALAMGGILAWALAASTPIFAG